MSASKLILILFLWKYCQAQQQCTAKKPFRMIDTSCADFTEVCIKKEYPPCATLLDACQQCPPSNFTVLMLLDILGITKGQQNITDSALRKNLAALQEQLSTQLAQATTKIGAKWGTISISILGIVITILIILVFMIIVWAIFTWIRSSKKGTVTHVRAPSEPEDHVDATRSPESIRLLVQNQRDSDPPSRSQANPGEINNAISNLKDYLDAKLDNFYVMLRPSSGLDTSYMVVKFEINGHDDVVDILVNISDNIVKIKRVICSKLLHSKAGDCKIMKLKHEGNMLDDNDYLSKYIQFASCREATVHCIFDENVDSSNILLLKLQGANQIPQIIQMKRSQEIGQLKQIAANLQIEGNLVIVRGKKELSSYDADTPLSECDLEDDDWLVEKQEEEKFIVSSIFGERNRIAIEYNNLNTLLDVKRQIAQVLGCSPDTVFLIFWNKYLSAEDEHLFKIGIGPMSALKYFQMRKLENIEKSPTWFKKGDYSFIYEAEETLTGIKIVLKEYEKNVSKNFKDNKFLINELITFQMMEPYKRILQLKDVYKDDKSVYVSMEMMTGSVEDFVATKPYQDKWLLQILEGLKYLHKNYIIYRSLNPSNILLDEQNNIKLSSFGFSKYLKSSDSNKIYEDLNLKNTAICRYIAPEILNNKLHGTPVDVWSYGTTLIYIFTSTKPYNHLQVYDDVLRASQSGDTEFEKLSSRLSKSQMGLLGMCLKRNPEERASIEMLIDKVNEP